MARVTAIGNSANKAVHHGDFIIVEKQLDMNHDVRRMVLFIGYAETPKQMCRFYNLENGYYVHKADFEPGASLDEVKDKLNEWFSREGLTGFVRSIQHIPSGNCEITLMSNKGDITIEGMNDHE